MFEQIRLPVVLVSGLHQVERRRVVGELLAGCIDAVVLHHDLWDAAGGLVTRRVHDAEGEFAPTVLHSATGCAGCTVRGDLLPELLAIADAGQYGLVVVELWGGGDPHPLVELITGGVVGGRRVAEVIELAGVVTAVDPLRVIGELSVPAALVACHPGGCVRDTRTRAEALAHQIEYATVLAVPRAPLGRPAGDDSEFRAGIAMLRQLHSTARLVTLGSGALIRAALAGFDLGAARHRVNPALAALPKERHEAGVSTLVWQRRRPLHPQRLHRALEALVPAAQRSRGRFWLANRPELLLAWDAAGASLAVEECGPWPAVLPDAAWEHWSAGAVADPCPPRGDRSQRLSFTARGLDVAGIVALLDSCLLTDAELVVGEPGWRALPDAFAAVLTPIG
ncbi:CobW family GTP-binding protein [Kitasatospora sp. NPDC052896]|uniref:CobW family GTP-binding protein n=1 Tax=Kitasatospora sp. NPDC052896 TaxID=3364061 RepID=UPI0037C9DDD0